MLTIPLDAQSGIPLYEQIYSFIKNEIQNKNLAYKDRLPSSRSLAANLQLSRNTVDLAYAQLVSEGYIESVPKSGYYVCRIGNLARITDGENPPEPGGVSFSPSYRYDFNPFGIDTASFPYSVWRKLSRNLLAGENRPLFESGDRQGDLPFREAIAKYLHASRGVNCIADHIVIGAGTAYLLQLLAGLLSIQTENRTVAFEDPTYIRAYRIFAGLGYRTVGLPIDREGLDAAALRKSGADIAYVTPSHQYPLGIVMSVKRRSELLSWAQEVPGRYLIEDDHDSEFRYKGKPIPSLQGMDAGGRVIYMGTFSRAVTPAIRAGYMVLPPALLLLYRQALSHYSNTVSRFDQAILTDFITQGHFERHLNKMRTLYRTKHDLLLRALKIFGRKIRITGEHAGLHLVVEFLEEGSEEALIEKAKEAGIRLFGLMEHYIAKPELPHPVILLGFANLPITDIEAGITLLYRVLYNV